MHCKICGYDNTDIDPLILYTRAKPHFVMCRCINCGVYYQNPMPTPEQLDQIYAADEPQDVAFRIDISQGLKTDSVPIHQDALAIYDFCRAYNIDYTKYMEIGCGSGHLIWSVQQLSLFDQIEGYEPSLPLVEACALPYLKHGYDTVLESVPDNSVSFFCMRHVIEHCPDPKWITEQVKRILIPEKSAVMIVTPNHDSINVWKYGGKWEWICPQHLWGFTPFSLSTLFGMKIIFQIKRGDARHSDGDQEITALCLT